jgi:hypothetical protein
VQKYPLTHSANEGICDVKINKFNPVLF